MPLQSELALRVVRGLDRREIGIERGLHVDDQFAVVGHAHDHVRADDLAFPDVVDLLLKVAVFDHAGELDEAAQRDFPPASPNLRASQGVDEVLRLFGERGLPELHRLELRFDGAVSLAPGPLQRLYLRVRSLERVAYRLDELFDGLLTLAELAPGAFGLRREVLFGQPQKGLAVGFERRLREIAEGLISEETLAEPEETTDSIDDELAAALAGELGVADLGNDDE